MPIRLVPGLVLSFMGACFPPLFLSGSASTAIAVLIPLRPLHRFFTAISPAGAPLAAALLPSGARACAAAMWPCASSMTVGIPEGR